MATHDIAEDDLELYALKKLTADRAAPVEERVLVCEGRRERRAAWDQYVGAMREAMRPVSGPDAVAVVRHLQHLADQLMTDDARTPSRPAALSKPRSPLRTASASPTQPCRWCCRNRTAQAG